MRIGRLGVVDPADAVVLRHDLDAVGVHPEGLQRIADVRRLHTKRPGEGGCRELGEAVVAVVVLHEGADTDWVPVLQAFLDGRLARYKWPRRWHRVAALPRTALGKVQKPAIKALLDGAAGT